MGKGTYLNQKLAKKTGFAARQAALRQPGSLPQKPARRLPDRRGIMKPSSSRS